LQRVGIALDQVSRELEAAGVHAFQQSFHSILEIVGPPDFGSLKMMALPVWQGEV
jgi:hypothetical protein